MQLQQIFKNAKAVVGPQGLASYVADTEAPDNLRIDQTGKMSKIMRNLFAQNYADRYKILDEINIL